LCLVQTGHVYNLIGEILTRRSDIIFMQEHWIHSWGKREIEDFMNILDFKSHIKCFDDNVLMDPLERRHDQAGFYIK
jgi:alkyl sulfatase BDS1-like metallo-beta-lactamase superfamily hydrolase